MLPDVLQRFKQVYERLAKDNLSALQSVYSPNIEFQDPLHRVQGYAAFESYFAALYTHLESCRFVIKGLFYQSNQACVTWTMTFVHPRLNGGKAVQVEGASHLQFNEHYIEKHRDYADLGQMLYEHIPVLGSVIRTVKKRAIA
ncbi:nuclear transport factor 2 family protein [Thiolinea disciformis]|uniref:nuclear transport factor 2 family protein n=1 Tax=Thiolinea disciformis TaxID=125614 RepID=UPI000373783E|nr:nuclear transport factor 2 family protein [Thiolinea disciformis]